MNIFFIRHGESELNAKHVYAGWSDTLLTERGRQQALNTKPIFDGMQMDHIFCSDLSRAQETARLIFGDAQLTLRQDIREINMEPISGKSETELEAIYGQRFRECERAWDFSPFGCESVPHFQERAYGFYSFLEGLDGAENVAVVTHAGIIRMISHKVLNTVYENRTHMKLNNASVTAFSYQRQHGWKLLKWNYTPGLLG